ncbi:MAG: DUF447 family protein [Candidatus Lokiarchaeota archaeon]|nr:DUF447 family protein [Candidatus Lokiarchaeota archaeon]
MDTKNLYPIDLGFKPNYLYEILATTISKIKKIPNTSAMGIRLTQDNFITIKPFPKTKTLQNLKETKIITINLVDDIHLYALSALKNEDLGIIFPREYYEYEELSYLFNSDSSPSKISIPFIKQSWAVLICVVSKENSVIKKDLLGDVSLIEFYLKPLKIKFFRNSAKLFNRAENLALESIIIATRIKIARERQNEVLFNELKSQLTSNINNIKRFGKNYQALETVDLINRYLGAPY